MQRYALNRNNTNFILSVFEYLKKLRPTSGNDFLKYHQFLAVEFMKNIDIDARGLLIRHPMGYGKTVTAVAIADAVASGKQTIVLLTKSLQDNFRGGIKQFVAMKTAADPNYPIGRLPPDDLEKWIDRNFSFVSMNASNMFKQVLRAAEGKATEEFDKAMEKKFGEVLKLGSLDDKFLIVDEAHNFFRAITSPSAGSNAKALYDMIIDAKNLSVVFLTGSLVSSDPFEMVPCFNMLGSRKPGVKIFPETYRDFHKYFVDPQTGMIKNKEKFQNRILGLVSHISYKSTPGAAAGITEPSKVEFPEELPTIVEKVPMESTQYTMYQLARDKEKEEAKRPGASGNQFGESRPLAKPGGGKSSSYRVRSRQLSNFCAPEGYRNENDPSKIPKDKVTSPKFEKILENIDKHPHRTGFVYSQFVGTGGLGSFAVFLENNGWKRVGSQVEAKEEQLIDGGYEPYDDDINNMYGNDDVMHRNHFNTAFPKRNFTSRSNIDVDQYLSNIEKELSGNHKYNKVNTIGKNTRLNNKHHKDHIRGGSEVSTTDSELLTTDIQITQDPDSILSEIDSVIGSEETIPADEELLGDDESHLSISDVIKEEAPVDSKVIEEILPKVKKPTGKPTIRYFAMITGAVSVEDRAAAQKLFNDEANKYGGKLDLLLISSTGAEGLDLKNVGHEHIMEPYWNWARIAQVKARGIRNDSHKTMLAEDKKVQVYIYLSVPPIVDGKPLSDEITTDMELYSESVKHQASIDSFLEATDEVSIECLINNEKFCRVCSPTDTPLFTDDIQKDIQRLDPCTAAKEKKITAKEIIIDGIKYYYTEDPSSIYEYRVFVLDETTNVYKPVRETDPILEKIIDAIKAEEGK